MKHFSYQRYIMLTWVARVKSVFYFFLPKNRRSGVVKHEGEEKNTSGEMPEATTQNKGVLYIPISEEIHRKLLELFSPYIKPNI